MSWGLSGPSETTSPFSTCSPSNTLSRRHLWISSSYGAPPSSGVITRRTLPLVSLPKETTPLFSARIAASFGFRASNRSATRGRPPVMSRVLEDSCGIRAITSPMPILAPFLRPDSAPPGRKYAAGASVLGSATGFPLASTTRTTGRRSLPAEGRSWVESTSMLVRPVSSSVW